MPPILRKNSSRTSHTHSQHYTLTQPNTTHTHTQTNVNENARTNVYEYARQRVNGVVGSGLGFQTLRCGHPNPLSAVLRFV